MATNQIKCNKGAVIKEINGVKYFKLKSSYSGDYTKNCGLLANEIDENFFFLRSYDIETAEFNDNNELVLTRVDGDKIVATLPDLPEILFKKLTFEFDKELGRLIVTFPDGTQEILDGFYVAGQDMKVATDYTIRGDGRICNPLRISETERTGTYAPAQFYYDRTDESAMPDGNKYGKGFRIVTKEKYEPFGRLYNYDGVLAIQSALTAINSPWRVPTREDWADMLNSAEYCDECRTHGSEDINEWKGCIAGARAKSTTSWDKYDGLDDGNPTDGIDNLPMTGSDGTFHVIPVGYAEGSRGATIKDEDKDVEGLKRIASFWSITPTGSKTKSAQPNIYTRTFSYDSTHVLEESSKPSSRLSIRLVKDYNYDCIDFFEYENILGYPVPCVLISNPDTKYSKIWTSVNIGFPEEQFNGVIGDQWSGLTEEDREYSERYYINEWNGAEWVKKQMKEGDSVVLIEGIPDVSGNSAYNHEWRVYKTEDNEYELIDTLSALKDEFSKEFENINERIDDLSDKLDKEIERSTNEDLEIWSALTQEIAEREDGDEALWNALSAETSERIAEDERLDEKIDAEIERAMSAETMLQEEIEAESEKIWSALTQEIAERIAADEDLQEQINTEKEEREAADELLQEEIDAETERAMSAETMLQEEIDAEIERAKAEEERLNGEDISGDEYTLFAENEIEPSLELLRNNGNTIKINFDANFGTLPTMGGITPGSRVTMYYASINSQKSVESLTRNDFTLRPVVIGTDARLTFKLGNPTEENYEKFLNGEINEDELRQLSANSYYLVLPKQYDGKFKILGANTISDITDSFVKLDVQTLFPGCYMYQSVNEDYFNIEYPEDKDNVNQEFVLTFITD